MITEQTVFVVDDDDSVRGSLCAFFDSMELAAEAFSTAEEFLDHFLPSRAGCLVTDLQMPGMDGLELQAQLTRMGSRLPVIVISGYATLQSGVRAMQQGAMTVLEKPCENRELRMAIMAALARDRENRETDSAGDRRIPLNIPPHLSRRQEEVLRLIVDGLPSKTIARELGISSKTVEKHRAALMKKMRANCVADLVRMTLRSTTSVSFHESQDGRKRNELDNRTCTAGCEPIPLIPRIA